LLETHAKRGEDATRPRRPAHRSTLGASYPRREQDMPDARIRQQIALLAALLIIRGLEAEYA
jgi:hypothetical protein